MAEMKPCPFCGDENTVVCDEESQFALGDCFEAWVECRSCLARGPVVGYEEAIVIPEKAHAKAVKEWNERGSEMLRNVAVRALWFEETCLARELELYAEDEDGRDEIIEELEGARKALAELGATQ